MAGTDPDAPARLADLVARLRAVGVVWAEDEAALLAARPDQEVLVARRLGGEPLEHVLGEVTFDDLTLQVGPGVFVPRRRTVLLARTAGRLLPPGGLLVEHCCGVAPVASWVAAHRSDARVRALDADPTAVGYAAGNLAAHGGGRAGVADLGRLGVLAPGSVDVLAANPPHVPTSRLSLMPREARDHERPSSLDGGEHGTALHAALAKAAARWLAPGGSVVAECGADQVEAVADLFVTAGLSTRVEADDEVAGTVVVGRRPGVGELRPAGRA